MAQKKRRGTGIIAEAARVRARQARRRPPIELGVGLELERISARRANYHEDTHRFWGIAASLGAALVGEGLERTTNPLVWAAALEMAKEKVLSIGGPAMAEDWEKAKAWREKAAKTGIVFAIIEAPEGFDEEDGDG